MKKRAVDQKKSQQRTINPLLLLLLLFPVLLLLSIVLDPYVQSLAISHQSYLLDAFFSVIGSITLLLFLLLIIPALYFLSHFQVRSGMALCVGFLSASIISVALKEIIGRERPLSGMEFAAPFFHSFPSMHTLIAFTLLPLLYFLFPRIRWLLVSYVTLIGVSRLYFNVHYLSDVVGGALIGLLIGTYLLLTLNKDAEKSEKKKVAKMVHFASDFSHEFEIKRKALHILFGVSLAILLSYGLLDWKSMGLLLAIGLVISFIEKKKRLFMVSDLLDSFERKDVRSDFPAQGLLYYLLGAWTCVLLFPLDIALGAIVILAFGDSFSHLFGTHFGSIKHPLNEEKYLEGTIAGVLFATLAALLYLPLLEALFASIAAMVVEALTLKYKKLRVDDNLLIPLVAASCALLIRILLA